MSWIETSQHPAGDRMQDVASRINADTSRFCDLIAEADRTQEWLAEGSPNIHQWLTARFGVAPNRARRLAKLSRRLQDLPQLSKRFAAGDISVDVVEMIAEVATPDNEMDLIEESENLDVPGVARLASRTKPPTPAESADRRATDHLFTQWDLMHQRMKLNGNLFGVGAQMVEDRLVAAARAIPKNLETGEYDDWGKRMADGLVETCATSDGDASVPTLTVHSDREALDPDATTGVAEIQSGPVVDKDTARLIACDSAVEVCLESKGRPLGVGRKSRTVPGWLRRQVKHRDHHCQAPGCGRTAFLQIHHIQHWADGGPTDLDNLILLCWWHHIFIHEHGWHITQDVNAKFVFRKPDWTPYPPRPIGG